MRNPTFDIMKFVAIMAMIVGHCVHDWRRPLIYLWHMPLFFIVSGYFFKTQPIINNIKRNAQRLLIPYFITGLSILAITALYYTPFDYKLIQDRAIVLLIGSINPQQWGIGYPIWFLMALFMCSCSYSILHKIFKSNVYISIAVIIITSTTYITTIRYSNYAPFTLLPAGMGLLFFHIGYLFKSYCSIRPKKSYIWWCCSIIALIISHNYGSPEMYCNIYPNLTANILGAIGGTFIILQLSNLFYHYFPKIALKTAQLGSISLLILIVHTLDFTFNFSPKITQHLLFFINDITPNIAERILFALIVSLLLYQIPIVRRALQLSKYQYLDIKTSKS